jgi:hypothetical protein
MDTSIDVNRLSRELRKRGTHRLLGNPFLGSLTAFLTVLLLIRLAANFYMIITISKTNPRIDALQIACAHFVFLSAYAVWIGTLGSCRIGLALPRLCFVNFALQGGRFRSMFMRKAAFFRPVTLACLSLMLLTVFVLSAICGRWGAISLRGLLVLGSTIIAAVIITTVIRSSDWSRSELQLMETLYLMLLVALNPDIGSKNGVLGIYFFFGSLHFSFSDLWQVVLAVGLIVVLAFLLLIVLRVSAGVNDLFGRRISLNPMVRWYWRFLRIRSWIFLYAVVAPVFISSTISLSFKRWTLFVSILFGVASYLYFISYSENTVREKWRCSFFDRGNMGFITSSLLNHAVLMAIPVLGYIVLT